jgi:DNA polymerase III epsilon subunit-like protein
LDHAWLGLLGLKISSQNTISFEGKMNQDKQNSINWARHVLSHPEGFFLLDTETTDLRNCEAVELAAIDLDGNVLIDTRIRPTIPIPPEVTKIHGIRDEDVRDSPTFPDIYPRLASLFNERRAIIYNAAFDTHVIDYCCRLHGLRSLDTIERSVCLMIWYAQFYGVWDNSRNDYKWQKLGGGHSALSDCQAALKRITCMANADISHGGGSCCD